MKDKEGATLTKKEDQLKRWAEHFEEILNRDAPTNPPNIPPAELQLQVNTGMPTKEEISKAIGKIKRGKAPGPDGIPPEALKGDVQTNVDILHKLYRKVWEEEEIPEDWRQGHLIKLPKKGDLTECQNWRGITLLSIPGKVLNRIILDRLKKELDGRLRDEQAGFRKDKSCTDQIATLRIIVEQSIEWNSSLYMTFIDYEKAFDSLDRNILWSLMRHYGIPEKFVRIIQKTYNDSVCKVVHSGTLTDPFKVHSGVRQGCLLSPLLFLLAIDWTMRRTTEDHREGIQWTLFKQLDDLDFADDIVLLSHKQQHAQNKADRLAATARQLGLNINKKKTKTMRINNKQEDKLKIDEEEIEEIDSFTYLGSIVSKDGGTDKDITTRIGKARTAFRILRPLWRSKVISRKTKLQIFNTNVKSVLLYGAETWRTTKNMTDKIQTFINRCLRNILNIHWPEKITNKELWERSGQDKMEKQIKQRKWSWIGHTMRKPMTNPTRQALRWNPQGKRRRGRPYNSWRRSTEAEAREAQYTWHQLETAAPNRVRWRRIVEDLCSPRSNRD